MPHSDATSETEYIQTLINGGVAVVPTDTLYGLVARADMPSAVERVNQLKQRPPEKGYIVLIASLDHCGTFNARITPSDLSCLETVWPGPVSVVLPAGGGFEHLSPNEKTVAFRLPDDQWLNELVRQTGPLIAPSANPSDQEPPTSAGAAHEYFGDAVDCYIDHGERSGEPSTLIALQDSIPTILRHGAGDDLVHRARRRTA